MWVLTPPPPKKKSNLDWVLGCSQVLKCVAVQNGWEPLNSKRFPKACEKESRESNMLDNSELSCCPCNVIARATTETKIFKKKFPTLFQKESASRLVTVALVRDPMERMVSAYANKMISINWSDTRELNNSQLRSQDFDIVESFMFWFITTFWGGDVAGLTNLTESWSLGGTGF